MFWFYFEKNYNKSNTNFLSKEIPKEKLLLRGNLVRKNRYVHIQKN